MAPTDNYFICTLIGEARGEPIEGIVGVGSVIRNRAKSANRAYKDICLAKGQFSCWLNDDPNFPIIQKYLTDLEVGNPINDPYIRQCIVIARAVQDEDFLDNTKGAKNYVTQARYNLAQARQDERFDKWILNLKPSVTLGHHVFLV